MDSNLTSKEMFSSIVSGFISSAMFLFFLWNLKPKFALSPHISCEYTQYRGCMTHLYYFKIINKSFLFKVYEIKVKAFVVKEINNLNGNDLLLTPIIMEFNSLALIERFNLRHIFQCYIGDNNLQSRTDYAAQFFTKADARKELNQDGHSIFFQVMAKHSLTGFTTVKTMKYHHALRIQNGKFLSGNSFKIVEYRQETE